MPIAITHDIKIVVEIAYQNSRLNNFDGNNMFAYRITIENQSDYTIRLLRRHWFITDVNNKNQEVEGEGVIGIQPVIEPGNSHQYVSGCSIQSDFGKMEGNYLMERQLDGKQFYVEIPEFKLIAPFRLN